MNILIISYYFPPYEGVASRRWAKYAKYLLRNNHNIEVLSNKFNGISPWNKDVKHFQDNITRIGSIEKAKRYQKALPNALLDKILWKLSYLWDKYLGGKTLSDPSQNSTPDFYKAALEIVGKKNIDTIIISGGPYYYLSILPKLKESTSCKLILDLRDPWPYQHNSYRMEKEVIEQQAKMEKEVIESADYIISVYQNILAKYPQKSGSKISHALDFEDFNFVEKSLKKNVHLKLVFGGHPYSEHKYFELLNSFVGRVKQEKEVKANCYIPGNLIPKIDFESHHLSFYPYKNTVQEFLLEQNSADAVLYIVREKHELEGNFTTKFYELIMTRKPILYFGPRTKVSDFIEEHELGYFIDKENLEKVMDTFLLNLKTKNIPKYFDLEPFGFEKEVIKLEEVLERVHAA